MPSLLSQSSSTCGFTQGQIGSVQGYRCTVLPKAFSAFIPSFSAFDEMLAGVLDLFENTVINQADSPTAMFDPGGSRRWY